MDAGAHSLKGLANGPCCKQGWGRAGARWLRAAAERGQTWCPLRYVCVCAICSTQGDTYTACKCRGYVYRVLGQQAPGASRRGSEGTHFANEGRGRHWRRRASEVRAKQKRTKAPRKPPSACKGCKCGSHSHCLCTRHANGGGARVAADAVQPFDSSSAQLLTATQIRNTIIVYNYCEILYSRVDRFDISENPPRKPWRGSTAQSGPGRKFGSVA